MDLQAELMASAAALGADACGIADLTPYRAQLTSLYGDERGQFSRAVVAAVFLPRRVVDELLQHPSHSYLTYYDTANALLNQVALILSNVLQKAGYDSLPIPASQRTGPAKDGGAFSHRLAAHLAGLGWIGKSCHLIHPAVGPRLRLVTVLTDAPLTAAQPLTGRCGDCTRCADHCPAGAIKGVPWAMGDDLSQRFDFQKCDQYLTEVRQVFGKRICGRCLAICPQGRWPDASEVGDGG